MAEETRTPPEMVTRMKDTTANPAALGLLAFGMTTVLLNLHNSGLFALNSMILGMGLFYGGIAQIIAGVMEWKKGNTFGTTAFISYGSFWLSFAALVMLPAPGFAAATDTTGIVFYLAMWGLFTLVMFFGTLKLTPALRWIFGSLFILYVLLVVGDITNSPAIKMLAGIEGIFCGFTAVYTRARYRLERRIQADSLEDIKEEN